MKIAVLWEKFIYTFQLEKESPFPKFIRKEMIPKNSNRIGYKHQHGIAIILLFLYNKIFITKVINIFIIFPIGKKHNAVTTVFLCINPFYPFSRCCS